MSYAGYVRLAYQEKQLFRFFAIVLSLEPLAFSFDAKVEHARCQQSVRTDGDARGSDTRCRE